MTPILFTSLFAIDVCVFYSLSYRSSVPFPLLVPLFLFICKTSCDHPVSRQKTRAGKCNFRGLALNFCSAFCNVWEDWNILLTLPHVSQFSCGREAWKWRKPVQLSRDYFYWNYPCVVRSSSVVLMVFELPLRERPENHKLSMILYKLKCIWYFNFYVTEVLRGELISFLGMRMIDFERSRYFLELAFQFRCIWSNLKNFNCTQPLL